LIFNIIIIYLIIEGKPFSAEIRFSDFDEFSAGQPMRHRLAVLRQLSARPIAVAVQLKWFKLFNKLNE
jgi:hypothetical protein